MSAKQKTKVVDLFCGAGGTSSGVARACRKLGVALDLTAINHWDLAISTHSANHIDAEHLCADLESVDPRDVVPEGRLRLLVASPECTHHSIARGGKPMNNQKRAGARYVLNWAEKLYIENILIENVKEFIDWGPLNTQGRPIESKRGLFFQSFVRDLEIMDYRIEWRILNAADYGAPTTRERFFLQARKKWGGVQITWPEPTHKKISATLAMFEEDTRKPWRAAREIIDWELPSRSIFDPKRKPLAESTMRRIVAGFEKRGKAGEPFLVILRNHMNTQSVDGPVPTITAGGQHVGLCETFITPVNEAFLTTAGGPEGQGRTPKDLSEPLGTILTEDHRALVEGFVTPTNHGSQDRRTHDIDEPMPTITTVDAFGFTEGHVRPVDEQFLTKFYGTATSAELADPLDTITTKDRFGLVHGRLVQSPDGKRYWVDIRFRMLHPKELAAATGFDPDYKFSGNREQVVKQIGNAVPVDLAEALVYEILSPAKQGKQPLEAAA